MMLLLACVLCLGVAGCTSRDEDDDNETYHTRDYIIGIGKWNTDRVKKADGNWTDFPFGEGKSFTIEFFDKKTTMGRASSSHGRTSTIQILNSLPMSMKAATPSMAKQSFVL